MRAPKVKREELAQRLDWVEKNRPQKDLAAELLQIFGFTAQEAGFALGVSPRTLTRAVNEGRVKPTATMGSTQVFSREALMELANG
jgi:DNA-directed RNA polymerase specialized sigma24 family protein